MYRQFSRVTLSLKSFLGTLLHGPQLLAFMPALVLGAYWIGGEFVLLLAAVGFPAVLMIWAMLQPLAERGADFESRCCTDGQENFRKSAAKALKSAQRRNRKTACIVLAPDDFEAIADRYGSAVADEMVEKLFERVCAILRSRDSVSRLPDNRFGVVIAPVPRLNLDIALQLAARVQAAAERPLKLGGATVYLSASVGFCLDSGFRDARGARLAEAAELALTVARRSGPSSIRAYSPEMEDQKPVARRRGSGVEQALEAGEIRPWFQPQISTETGEVTGFEALARWQQPGDAVVPPAEFLPAIQKAGKMELLGAVMLSQALEALRKWDALGLTVPRIGVNFSPEELRNPQLVQKVEWELDRLDLSADRLAVEILETVVATSPDDVVARNIRGLSELGCQIDLDDFGTGHASISSIRRFDIERLKIDRSFVMKVDQDPEQQRMVSAILLMAERLGLDTLAEGVETAGEHAMLAQLGCGHVQGYGIGRPMPFEATEGWYRDHMARISAPPDIGSRAG